jgi:hypothetical protein
MTKSSMILFTLMLPVAAGFGVMLVSVELVGFYYEVTVDLCVSARAVPQRGVKSVFYHVKRARDSLGKAGKWDVVEDEHLRRSACLAVLSAVIINRASNTELFRHTEATGLR